MLIAWCVDRTKSVEDCPVVVQFFGTVASANNVYPQRSNVTVEWTTSGLMPSTAVVSLWRNDAKVRDFGVLDVENGAFFWRVGEDLEVGSGYELVIDVVDVDDSDSAPVATGRSSLFSISPPGLLLYRLSCTCGFVFTFSRLPLLLFSGPVPCANECTGHGACVNGTCVCQVESFVCLCVDSS